MAASSKARKPRKPPATAARRDGYLGWDEATLSPVYDPARGLGLETRYTVFRRMREIGPEEIAGIYADGIGRRIVEIPILQALRGGWSLDVEPAYQAAADRVQARAEEVELRRWVERAAIWACRDGWSLSVQGWRGSAGPALQPWPEAREPAAGRLVWVRPAYRWDCANPTVYFGPEHPNFCSPRWISVYRIRPDVESDIAYLDGSWLGNVHGSRFTRLSTTTGRTDYERVAQYLVNLLAGGGGIAGALSRANIGVFKVQDWAQKVRRNDAEAYGRIRAHFEALSAFAPLVLDQKLEDFTSIANGALGGTENALFALSWLVSAASGIPMVELFGLEPGGFSGGEETSRRWHDTLEARRRWVEPAIRSVLDGLWAETLGRPSVPAYQIVWAPLRQPSTDERATLVTSLTSAARSALELGLTTPESVRAGLAATPEADLWAWEVEAPEPTEADPSAVGSAVVGPAAEELALNGAQTSSFVAVLTAVASGEIAPEAAVALLGIAFPAASDAAIRAAVAAQAALRAPAAAPTAPAAPPSSGPAPATAPGPGQETTDAPEAVPPPAVVAGTWVEAGEAEARSGVVARKVKALGRAGRIGRRKLGSRWEYRLEDLLRVAAEAVLEPDPGEPDPEDEGGPVEDEDPDEYVARA